MTVTLDIFTQDERLWYKVSHERFMYIINRHDVNTCNISSNSYGEFLFISIVVDKKEKKMATFFGLGYHDVREKPLVDEWHFYEWHLHDFEKTSEDKINIVYVTEDILRRKKEIESIYKDYKQTKRSEILEYIADMADDDYLYVEKEYIEDILDDICNE